jgi:hypothetical protein
MAKMSKFNAWVSIYGSDDAVRAVHRFMQAAYSNPPSEVMMRFFVELQLAMRRDLGDPESTLDVMDLLGIRIKDVYEGEMASLMVAPLPAFYERVGWDPPWGERYD